MTEYDEVEDTPTFPMSQDDCLEWLDRNTCDAEALLREADPKLVAAFNRADKALVDYLTRVREFFPDAQYYTANGGFRLMLGDPHNQSGTIARPELLALSGRAQIGDGDF